MCICSLRYPARNAHEPFCDPWPVPICNILPFYLINGKILEQNFPEHKMCVLIFYTTFASNISPSKKKWAKYDQKRILVFTWSTPYSRPNLMKLVFSPQTLQKFSNIKFHGNPSGGSRVVSCGRTDKKKLINAFLNFANVSNKTTTHYSYSSVL